MKKKVTAPYFLYPTVFFLFAALLPYLFFPKGDIHIFLNTFHSSFFDYIFVVATWFGYGFIPFLVGLFFLLVQYRYSFVLILSAALSGIMVQILKRVVFGDCPRPVAFIGEQYSLYLVEGVKQLSHFSFPSGHATTAFALCYGLALFSTSRIWQLVLFLTAFLIAYSRVYLSQHFLLDVGVGAALGAICCFGVYVWLHNVRGNWLDKNLTQQLYK